MYKKKLILIPLIFNFLTTNNVWAGCCESSNSQNLFADHNVVAEIAITSKKSIKTADGKIHTRYEGNLKEAFKGTASKKVTFDSLGGSIDKTTEFSSQSIDLDQGKNYILHFQKNNVGELEANPFSVEKMPEKSADITDTRNFYRKSARGIKNKTRKIQASSTKILTQQDSGSLNNPGSLLTATGYMEFNSIPARFTESDAGLAIPYIVDIDPSKLPASMTSAMALQIVKDAADAWSANSSIRFRYEGTASFGQSASSNTLPKDGKIRIQLHDNYGSISSLSTLGIGGGSFTTGANFEGGNVDNQNFHKRINGYIVMNHLASSVQNSNGFKEVLIHEMGHSLGLAHSSENSAETNLNLKDATMFYAIHNDARGTTIRNYDQTAVFYGYPTNTPPFSINRLLRVVTGSPQPTGAGIDRITIAALDLQTPTSTTISIIPSSNTSNSGVFSINGNSLIYTPTGSFSDAVLSDNQIETGSFYDKVSFQISDGINKSPIYSFRIIGFHRDSQPSDGLPDSWLSTYFSNATPGAVGSNKHPNSDPDGDGLNNQTERYLGTNPIDRNSGPATNSFDFSNRTYTINLTRFVPYTIESSTNLTSWTPRRSITNFSTPISQPIQFSEDLGAKRIFYRAKVTP
jgi:Matrixin